MTCRCGTRQRTGLAGRRDVPQVRELDGRRKRFLLRNRPDQPMSGYTSRRHAGHWKQCRGGQGIQHVLDRFKGSVPSGHWRVHQPTGEPSGPTRPRRRGASRRRPRQPSAAPDGVSGAVAGSGSTGRVRRPWRCGGRRPGAPGCTEPASGRRGPRSARRRARQLLVPDPPSPSPWVSPAKAGRCGAGAGDERDDGGEGGGPDLVGAVGVHDVLLRWWLLMPPRWF